MGEGKGGGGRIRVQVSKNAGDGNHVRAGQQTAGKHIGLPLPVGLGLAFLVVVPVAVLLVAHSFDGLYGQDAYAYYDYAVGPLRASVQALKPPPPFFWPPGYPLLVALSSFVLGPRPVAAQLVSLVAGGLVPVLTALLARQVWQEGRKGWFVPVLAGLLAALVGQLWQSSAVIMSDTAGLAAATLGIWALARYGCYDESYLGDRANTSVRPYWLILAAGALAFAVLVRWVMAVIAIPAAAYALVVLARQQRRMAIRHTAVAGLAAVLVLALVWGPALNAILSSGGDVPAFTVDRGPVTWHPFNALRRAFHTADGFLQYRLPSAVYYALAPAHRFYLTPLLAPLLLPGVWVVLRQRAWASLFLLLGWAGAVYVFLAGIPLQNLRFTLTYLPPLAILAAIGADAARRWLNRDWRRLFAAILAVGLMGMAYGGWGLTHHFIARKQTDLGTVRWAEAQIPPDGQLLTFGLTLTFQHYTGVAVQDLYVLAPADLEVLARSGAPLYLLLDLENVERQWQGKTPATNYRWLKTHTNLIPLGKRPPYSLFRKESLPRHQNLPQRYRDTKSFGFCGKQVGARGFAAASLRGGVFGPCASR